MSVFACPLLHGGFHLQRQFGTIQLVSFPCLSVLLFEFLRYKDWVIQTGTPISMTIVDVNHAEGEYSPILMTSSKKGG